MAGEGTCLSMFKQQSCNGAWWQVSINESLRFDGFSVTEMVQPVQPFAWIFAKVFDIENLKTQARFLGKNALLVGAIFPASRVDVVNFFCWTVRTK